MAGGTNIGWTPASHTEFDGNRSVTDCKTFLRPPLHLGGRIPAVCSFHAYVALSRVRFPAGAGNFSLHHRVLNGSGAHPASYPMGTRDSFLGDKAAGA
jgi:hypothetical protein